MIKLSLQTIGWLTAHTPEWLLSALARLLGAAVFRLLPRRRRLFFSNLDHAFPDRPRAWQARIARESSCRVVETLLWSLASPFLSNERLRETSSMAPEAKRFFEEHHRAPYPLIVASPHIAYWESLTTLGIHMDVPVPEFGVIFRPLDNPDADAWVKSTRERHGLRLLSRKDGLTESFRILRRKGVVGVLFDQNAGLQGALTLLFGRVCSTSELPGLLAERSSARIMVFYPRRLGFWRLSFEADEIHYDGTAAGVTIALNRWLEDKLAGDDNLCASWLWSHDRWRHQDIPSKRLRLESKRDLLPLDLKARGLESPARKTRLWIRLPNWLGDVVMALPLIRAVRESRPDAEMTLVGKAAFKPLIDAWGVADRYESLPQQGLSYFAKFFRFRRRQPDFCLLFTHSLRGDIEAWLTGSPQRFGVVKHGRRRPLLTHRFEVPADFDESRHHQFELWENYLRHFGLSPTPDRSPKRSASPAQNRIGLITGSENNPQKRWPVSHWRTFLERFLVRNPATEILLFGTTNDRAITQAVAQGFGPQVQDLAGRTDLASYMQGLQSCRLLVTNDTGGMHLANALGVPLVALFGPTNPVRTGPVFSSPYTLLQPADCPPFGGRSLAELSPETVIDAVNRAFSAPAASVSA